MPPYSSYYDSSSYDSNRRRRRDAYSQNDICDCQPDGVFEKTPFFRRPGTFEQNLTSNFLNDESHVHC